MGLVFFPEGNLHQRFFLRHAQDGHAGIKAAGDQAEHPFAGQQSAANMLSE